MGKSFIKIKSITYATKGRDVLLKKGFNAKVIRNPHPSAKDGCAYGIYVNGNIDIAYEVLIKAGIKVNGISKDDAS